MTNNELMTIRRNAQEIARLNRERARLEAQLRDRDTLLIDSMVSAMLSCGRPIEASAERLLRSLLRLAMEGRLTTEQAQTALGRVSLAIFIVEENLF